MKGYEKKKKRKKKGIALLLSAALLCQTVPLYSTQAAQGADGLCPHHPAHTPECGYREAAEGAPCAHQHTQECYQTVQQCVHQHTQECYPLIPAETGMAAGEAAAQGQAQETDAPAEPDVQVRADEPTACTHVCSEESGCITKTETCVHTAHDASCGYADAQEAMPCQLVCQECIREEEARQAAEESERLAAEESKRAAESEKAAAEAEKKAKETEEKTEPESKALKAENSAAKVTIGETVTEYTDITAAFAAADGQTATIELLEDQVRTRITVTSGNITICGAGSLGYLTNQGAALTINADASGLTCEKGEVNITGGTISDLTCEGGVVNIAGGSIACMVCEGGTTTVSSGRISEIEERVGLTFLIDALVLEPENLELLSGASQRLTVTVETDIVAPMLLQGRLSSDPEFVMEEMQIPSAGVYHIEIPAQNVGTETYTVSLGEKSVFCTVTVKEAGGEAPQLTLDYEKETINTTADMEYSTDGNTWTPCTDDMTVSAFGWDGSAPKTVQIREKATETQFAGASAEVTIPARPQLTVSEVAEGITASTLAAKISGGSGASALQYSMSEASGTQVQDWKDVPESGEVLFENLKAGREYIVEARCSATDQSFEGWNSATVRTADAQYTISIPEKAQAGGRDVQIKVDESEPFALGYGGKVTVQVAEGITDGAVTLTREGDPGHTLTSAVLVNGTPFSEEESIAVFEEASTERAERISFAQPQKEGPAGYYSGTVTFAVEYCQ